MNSLSLTTLLVLSHGARTSTGFRSFSHQVVMNRVAASRTQAFAPPQVIAATHTEANWSPSTILRNVHLADGLRHIDIEVSDVTATQYLHAGQYVKVRKAGCKPALFAIASPPDNRRTFSFLAKESGNHQFVLDLPPGANIDLSAPLGRGFQIKAVLDSSAASPITHVLLMACGSGLAPITAAIESGCLQGGANNVEEESPCTVSVPRSVLLYIGARSPAHLPYAEKYAEWEKMGVKVVPVFSRTEGRYVQEALRADSLASPASTMALLCGMKGMTDAARALLLSAGVPENRILLNY